MDAVDELWMAWGEKLVDVIAGMGVEMRPEPDGPGNMHFFGDTSGGGLVHLVTWPNTENMTSLNLYGKHRTANPVGFIAIQGSEIHVGGHGTFHRFSLTDATRLYGYLREFRAKAMEARTRNGSVTA